MSIAPSLEFVLHVLQRHQAGARQLEVIPAISKPFAEEGPVLQTAVEQAGGVFLDVSVLGAGVDGTMDPTLKAQVEASLSGGLGLPPRVVVSARGDRVEATVDRVDWMSSTSPGHRTLMGIATSLFDRRLSQVELAMVTYAEAGLDSVAATAAWRLFTEDLPLYRIGQLRTLVVVVQSAVARTSLYCGPGLSAQFRLGSSLDRRKRWTVDRPAIRNLALPQRRGLTVLFLGAGFSRSSGLPLGNELRDEALRRIVAGTPMDPYPLLAEAFHQHLTDNGRFLPSELGQSLDSFAEGLTLERVLREEFHLHGIGGSPTLADFQARAVAAVGSAGSAVHDLRAIASLRRRLVIATVNFDEVLEDGGTFRVFAEDREFAGFPKYLDKYRRRGGDVPLLKLHGTMSRPSTIVATVDAVARGLSTDKTRALESLTSRRQPPVRWAYVGYSMRDSDVASALALRRFQDGTDEVWVSPFPIKPAAAFVQEHRDYRLLPGFWERSITQGADVFIAELRDAWGA